MISLSISRRPCSRAAAPTLVLLHGWGYCKSAWPDSWLQALEQGYNLWLVDLPGHGDDTCQSLQDADLRILDSWLQLLAASLPTQYSLLGWSLGGQVAWRLAQLQPDRVSALVALASNPSFVQRSDWPHAMSVAVLQQFTTAFAHTANKTLQRFCALQSQGGEQPTIINKQLRTRVQCRASLSMGLDWLAQLDLRETWQALSMPSLLLLAAEDALVPAAVFNDLHQLSPNQTIATLNGCHAFAWQHALTDKDRLLPYVGDFLEQLDV